MTDANEVITVREDSHGPYREQAQFSQLIKGIFHGHRNWKDLRAEQREAIDMMIVKMSRIMSGNADEPDHWIDMSGYAMLCYNLLTTGDHLGRGG